MKLNLGCGRDIARGYLNVDHAALPGVGLVHDLDVMPWPVLDGSASEIKAYDIFEHVADAVGFMVECHRVLKRSGYLRIRTPDIGANLMVAFTDPTHRRFPTQWTFDYWIPGTQFYELHNGAYGGVAFELVSRAHDQSGNQLVTLRRLAVTRADMVDPVEHAA